MVEKSDVFCRGTREQAGKLSGGEIAGFKSERFASGGAEAFEFEDAALGREREASGGFFFVVDNFGEEDFRDGREATAAHLFGVGHQLIEVDFGGGDEGADSAAAFDDAFALERRQCVARGHEADFVEAGEFPFGGDGIAGLEFAGFDDAADRALNAAIRGNTVVALREHFRSSTQHPGSQQPNHTPSLRSARIKTKQPSNGLMEQQTTVAKSLDIHTGFSRPAKSRPPAPRELEIPVIRPGQIPGGKRSTPPQSGE